jgi:hypothetical protein
MQTKIILLGFVGLVALLFYFLLRGESGELLLGNGGFTPAAHFAVDALQSSKEPVSGEKTLQKSNQAPPTVSEKKTPVIPRPPTAVSPPPPALPLAGSVAHVVISEIQFSGSTGSTTRDFIELYNPTGTDLNLAGWKLRKRTQSGNESSLKVFGTGKSIPAHGFFLWANSDDGYAASIGADESSTASLAAHNSLALEDSSGTVIDAVAWGVDLQNPFFEGMSLTAVLEANQSLERKAWQRSCLSPFASGELWGNGCDTDNNSGDFEVRALAHPQHAESPLEP